MRIFISQFLHISLFFRTIGQPEDAADPAGSLDASSLRLFPLTCASGFPCSFGQ